MAKGPWRVQVTYFSGQQHRTKDHSVNDPDTDVQFVGGGRWILIKAVGGNRFMMPIQRILGVYIDQYFGQGDPPEDMS